MSLLSVITDYGLIVSTVITDGDLHRCGTAKKPKSQNGWYVTFDRGKAAVYGDWQLGDGFEYWADEGVTKDYRSDYKIIKEKKQASGSEEARAYFESCTHDGFSDYLKNKRIFPHGARFDGKVLVIPCQDYEGKIWSYQKIYNDGSKYFMPSGRVKGCYYPIFPARNVSRDERVVVCEGFATGATIHQETGLPVIVAFNAGNLKEVCQSVIFRNLIVAADNDESGVGEKAAQETGYPYVMPDTIGQDFNDAWQAGRDIKPYFETIESETQANIKVTGLVGEIADWITATAIRPQPELGLAAAVAFMGMVKSRRIMGKTNLRTNWYSLALAPTGSGKDHPIYAIGRLAKVCGLDDSMIGEPTSGTGLLVGIQKAKLSGFLVLDEVGRYMGNISQKGSGTHMKEIADCFVKLFSAAGRVYKGKQYANEKLNPAITLDQGHLSILGYSVKEKLLAACTSSEIVDGFLNRWVLFATDGRPRIQEMPESNKPPQELIDKVRGWVDSFPIQMDNYGELTPTIITFTPEAWAIFLAFREKMEETIARAKSPADKLYTRTCEHVEKLAMILSDGAFIGIPEVTQAIAIVERSNKALIKFCGMIADNVSEQDYVRVREIIREFGEIKKSQLTIKCQFVQGGTKRIADIIAALLDAGIISARIDKTRTVYKFIGDVI